MAHRYPLFFYFSILKNYTIFAYLHLFIKYSYIWNADNKGLLACKIIFDDDRKVQLMIIQWKCIMICIFNVDFYDVIF